MARATPILKVEKLSLNFPDSSAARPGKKSGHILNNVSLTLYSGKTLALVGESGSGKTVTALSILQLLGDARYGKDSKILFEKNNLLSLEAEKMRTIRGHRIAMIFQEPMTSLNPLHTIGKQLREAILLHKSMSRAAVNARVKELLALVQLESLHARLEAYPHELSGGQRQRIMIAMALAHNPDILIADEPTTALDVTVQKQILALLESIQEKLGMAILLITHDLHLVRKVAHHVAIMREGEVVESGATSQIFSKPETAYAKKLLSAEPRTAPVKLPEKPKKIFECSMLTVEFPRQSSWFKQQDPIRVIDDVKLSVHEGQTLGIVGESGSGKTTLALALLRLIPSKGTIIYDNKYIRVLEPEKMRTLRRDLQIVFQDPFASLNPRMTVEGVITEGLRAHRIGANDLARRDIAAEMLQKVGLETSMLDRYPHQFSGGQRQRIALARALAVSPKLLVLDEPTSSLDIIVQCEIIELLKKLQAKEKLAYIFISHDLRVIKSISHQVLVLHHGKVVESGTRNEVLDRPKHSYTQNLLEAAFG